MVYVAPLNRSCEPKVVINIEWEPAQRKYRDNEDQKSHNFAFEFFS